MRAVHAIVPRIAIARMMANITIDTLIGSIPLFGDAFDFAYKANLKNLRIYEESLIDRRRCQWMARLTGPGAARDRSRDAGIVLTPLRKTEGVPW